MRIRFAFNAHRSGLYASALQVDFTNWIETEFNAHSPQSTYACTFKWIETGSDLGVVSFTMAAGWTADETKALIGIWGEEEVQNALDGVVRNKTIYQKIAAAMARLGYAKTWQQCRTKVKNLVQKYKKVSLTAVNVFIALLCLGKRLQQRQRTW